LTAWRWKSSIRPDGGDGLAKRKGRRRQAKSEGKSGTKLRAETICHFAIMRCRIIVIDRAASLPVSGFPIREARLWQVRAAGPPVHRVPRRARPRCSTDAWPSSRNGCDGIAASPKYDLHRDQAHVIGVQELFVVSRSCSLVSGSSSTTRMRRRVLAIPFASPDHRLILASMRKLTYSSGTDPLVI
jgi:hypothetical protein